MVSKGDFSSSIEYERALRAEEFQGIQPVDPKLAGDCQQDVVESVGRSSGSIGACALRPEGCTYLNDKIGGVSGACLKRVVGVELPVKS